MAPGGPESRNTADTTSKQTEAHRNRTGTHQKHSRPHRKRNTPEPHVHTDSHRLTLIHNDSHSAGPTAPGERESRHTPKPHQNIQKHTETARGHTRNTPEYTAYIA
jgi:hypothetical protein